MYPFLACLLIYSLLFAVCFLFIQHACLLIACLRCYLSAPPTSLLPTCMLMIVICMLGLLAAYLFSDCLSAACCLHYAYCCVPVSFPLFACLLYDFLTVQLHVFILCVCLLLVCCMIWAVAGPVHNLDLTVVG